MKHKKLVATYLLLLACLLGGMHVLGQPSVTEEAFGKQKLLRDLHVFKGIREKANSGLYKYRSENQIDSIYRWAFSQVTEQTTLRGFFKIIAALTDFEGSSHNDTKFSDAVLKQLDSLPIFFPLPIYILNNEALLVNRANDTIPVGATITHINDIAADTILARLPKYITADGYNTSSKFIYLHRDFAFYFWVEFGAFNSFNIRFRRPGSVVAEAAQFAAVPLKAYQSRYRLRHSKPSENTYTAQSKYHFTFLDTGIAQLTVHSFGIGSGPRSPLHKAYLQFLDSCFGILKARGTPVLIVDIRGNGGGSDPNDMVTFSYLAQAPFRENVGAFVSFQKIPYWKYMNYPGSFFKRLIAKQVFTRRIRKEFCISRDGVYYQGHHSNNTPRMPQANAFKGQVFLLVDERVASAASMFTALVRGRTQATVIGAETNGGYYGHNGHQPVEYILPHTGIVTDFSIVNLVQDVPMMASQPYGYGIMPDYEPKRSVADFLANRDVVLEVALHLARQGMYKK
jgi:hypothetical protein